MGSSSKHFVNHIDTANFNEGIECIKEMSQTMDEVLNNLDEIKACLSESWEGEGKDSFESAFQIMRRKLTDGSEVTKSMLEKLVASRDEFIATDMGISNKFQETDN